MLNACIKVITEVDTENVEVDITSQFLYIRPVQIILGRKEKFWPIRRIVSILKN